MSRVMLTDGQKEFLTWVNNFKTLSIHQKEAIKLCFQYGYIKGLERNKILNYLRAAYIKEYAHVLKERKKYNNDEKKH